jgi:hypothetical protein
MVDNEALLSGPLDRLPAEVMRKVVAMVEDDVDRLCVGLTCRMSTGSTSYSPLWTTAADAA